MIGPRVPIEVAKTVLEVADVAWTAVEGHHRRHDSSTRKMESIDSGFEDIQALRSENERLHQLLQNNLEIFKQLASAPVVLDDCPSDLHDRLLSAINSETLLVHLKSQHQIPSCTFASDEPSDMSDSLINIESKDPSSWVWITKEKVPHDYEENCEIDGENYLVLTEEHVVDAVANFMAKCIMANPKALKMSPVELQKALEKAVSGMNKLEKMLSIWKAGKMLCTLTTWGLALASLYQGRAVLKLATLGVHHSSKLALKIL